MVEAPRTEEKISEFCSKKIGNGDQPFSSFVRGIIAALFNCNIRSADARFCVSATTVIFAPRTLALMLFRKRSSGLFGPLLIKSSRSKYDCSVREKFRPSLRQENQPWGGFFVSSPQSAVISSAYSSMLWEGQIGIPRRAPGLCNKTKQSG